MAPTSVAVRILLLVAVVLAGVAGCGDDVEVSGSVGAPETPETPETGSAGEITQVCSLSLRLSLPDSQTGTEAPFGIEYDQWNGRFAPEGYGPRCDFGNVSGRIYVYDALSSDYQDRVLYLTLDDPLGVEPAVIDATCRYFAYEPPSLESFVVYDAAGLPAPQRFWDPGPAAEVVAIECTDVAPDELGDLVPPDALPEPCDGGCAANE